MTEFTIRNIQLLSEQQTQELGYRIEYVLANGFVGRFLAPKSEVEEFGLEKLIEADLLKVKPALDLLDELKEKYEGKILTL